MARAARAAENDCLPRDRERLPELRGRALVWDVVADDFSELHAHLPAAVRAPGPDGELAVFLVNKEERRIPYTTLQNYGGVAAHFVETTTNLTVVQMPEQTALASYRIYGAGPPGALPAVNKPDSVMVPPSATTAQEGVMSKMLPFVSRPTAVNCCVPFTGTVAFGVTSMLASSGLAQAPANRPTAATVARQGKKRRWGLVIYGS